MNAQIMGLGLKLGSGTVVVVCLMTHLFRLGEPTFWNEFKEFSDWAMHKYKLVVLPTITLYPLNLNWRFLSAARHFYARLQYMHFGNNSNKHDPIFSLWKPFMRTIQEMKGECSILPFSTEPLAIRNQADPKDPILVSCDGEFLHGAGKADDWANGMPAMLEKQFLHELVQGVKEIQSSTTLVTPSLDSIIAGLNRQSASRAHQMAKFSSLAPPTWSSFGAISSTWPSRRG